MRRQESFGRAAPYARNCPGECLRSCKGPKAKTRKDSTASKGLSSLNRQNSPLAERTAELRSLPLPTQKIFREKPVAKGKGNLQRFLAAKASIQLRSLPLPTQRGLTSTVLRSLTLPTQEIFRGKSQRQSSEGSCSIKEIIQLRSLPLPRQKGLTWCKIAAELRSLRSLRTPSASLPAGAFRQGLASQLPAAANKSEL